MPPNTANSFMKLMQTQKRQFIADYVEETLLAAVDDGIVLHFTENAMTEPTFYARQLENEATLQAKDIFGRVLKRYLIEAKKFSPDGPYNDVVEHVGNEYKPSPNQDEQNAFERIGEAHFYFLKNKKINTEKECQQETALFLLKSPLEFADFNSKSLLSKQEQRNFTTILSTLRKIAGGF